MVQFTLQKQSQVIAQAKKDHPPLPFILAAVCMLL